MNQNQFLKTQKVLRLSTVNRKGIPHIVPVWYLYSNKKFYIGTNARTKKAKNLGQNKKVSFCVDVGIKSPDIFGVMGTGKANLVLDESKMKRIAKKILLRYFRSLKNKSAIDL